MKRACAWGLVGMGLILAGKFANAEELVSKTIELPIESIVVVQHPYDGQDDVRVVMSGHLPDACYEIDGREAWVESDPHVIDARVYAGRKHYEVCRPGGILPQIMKLPVPFHIELSLGALPEGSYRIFYHAPGLVEGVTGFEVNQEGVFNER